MKSTKSIWLAAAYLACGAKHEKTDKTDPKHMEFYFSPPAGEFQTGELAKIPENRLEDIESGWINETLQVNAVAYANAMQRLKSVIHSS